MTTDVAVIEDVPVRHFNPNDHIMQIPNKGGKSDYLPVQWRLVWFRELCPQGTIESELVLLELDRETEEEAYVWNSETRRSEKVIKRANGLAVFKAVVTDGKGGKAEAYKSEKAASFGDFIEKANTGAVGRALAMLGYGTQFAEMELSEEERIVDAPVERKPAKSYQERKPFVEGSVSVKEEPKPALQTVPAQPHAQDDGTGERLTQVRQLFATIFKAEKWEPFKVHTLGMPVADEGLSIDELDRLYAALLDKKTARAS